MFIKKIGSTETIVFSESFDDIHARDLISYSKLYLTGSSEHVDEVIMSLKWGGPWNQLSSTVRMCYYLQFILEI